MAKKSLILKSQRTPKFKVRRYNRCQVCGRPRAYMVKFGLCRVCFRELVIKMKYVGGKVPAVSGLRRISKPGLRVYARKTEMPRVLGGLGIAIVSTSSGVMTGREAERKGLGGEVLAFIW